MDKLNKFVNVKTYAFHHAPITVKLNLNCVQGIDVEPFDFFKDKCVYLYTTVGKFTINYLDVKLFEAVLK